MALPRALLALLLISGEGCSVSKIDRMYADASPMEGGARGVETGAGYLPSQLPPDFHCDPTLESLRDTIFVSSCGFDSCHGDNNFAYGLWLTADTARITGELVGAPSQSCKPETLVVAGDPERSFLYDKLVAKKPICGARMPYGIEPLPEPALECVRSWIGSL